MANSYIAEILASAGEIELIELGSKVKEIEKKISSLKSDVKITLENRYVNFLPLVYQNDKLLDKSKLLSTEIERLCVCIKDQTKRNLTNSTEELKNLSEALVENTKCIHFVSKLLDFDTELKKVTEYHEAHRYYDAVLALNLIELQLTENCEYLDCLDIYKGLKWEYDLLSSHLVSVLLKKWRKYITWSEKQSNKKEEKLVLTVDLKEEDKACIKAFHCLDSVTFEFELKKFADSFCSKFLCKVITNPCSVAVDVDSVVLSKGVKTPNCFEVLSNLTLLLNFINSKLNVDLGKGGSTITLLAKMISNEFLQCLVKNCLSNSVPRKREDLQHYVEVVDEIIKFNSLLLQIGFIKEDDTCLMKYATDIELLFTNKTCESYFEAARTIMKKDLSNMTQITAEDFQETVDDDNSNTSILTELPKSVFLFPSCQISKSVLELLKLVEEILNESSESNGSLALTLFATARNILKMYCDIVPEFHRKLLDSIPQQSALYHNNCMFIAHQLQKLILDFKQKCESNGMMKSRPVTFIDINSILKCQAAKVIKDQLLSQRRHLIDIICDSGLVTLSDNPQFPQGVEKAIRQCLRQLALLQNVWQHVLPTNVYCKVMGLLCKSLVEEIFDKVVAAKDIPEDTALKLVSVFTIILQKGPLVFPEPREIHQYVQNWNKFCELVRLLEANLRQVEDRWADGKGPLALEFKPDQVKQMVRALFQISDKRSALLAKIK